MDLASAYEALVPSRAFKRSLALCGAGQARFGRPVAVAP